MTSDELASILAKHSVWLRGEPDGERADLRWANLRRADLRRADLRWADLRWADLRWADLRWADLRRADLRWADLRRADLRWADLRRADLRWADLSGADLRGAVNFAIVGQTQDGHLVYAYPDDHNVLVARAGCKTLVGIQAARDYIANAEMGEIERADMLSLVEHGARLATARGWKLEPEAAKGE